jgi:Ni/Co efflux regulator RcnB
MRNALLTIVILSCWATASMAADRRDNGQQQSKQVEHTQEAGDGQQQSKRAEHTRVTRNDADGSFMDQASSGRGDCTPKPPEGDPEAPQNKVEYGGGG